MTCSLIIRAAPTLAPLLAERLGWEAAQLGALSALLTLGTVLFLSLGMPFIRRAGPMRALQWGMLCLTAGAVLLVWPTPAGIMVGSFLMGLGSGPGSSASNVVLNRYAPPGHQGLAFSLKQSGVPMGSILAGLTLPALAAAYGLDGALWAIAALGFLTVVAMQRVRKPVDAQRDREQPMGWTVWLAPQNLAGTLAVLRTPALLRAGLSGACLGIGQGAWFVFLVTYLVTEQGYSVARAGALFALMQAASLVGRPVLGWITDRLGRTEPVLAGAGLVSCLATLLLAALQPSWPAWCAMAVAVLGGLSVSAWNGVQILQTTRLAPPGRVAEGSAAVAVVAFLGFGVSPLIMAAGHALTGSLAWAFVATGVLTLGVVPLQWRGSRP